jgi:hypothetical protein
MPAVCSKRPQQKTKLHLTLLSNMAANDNTAHALPSPLRRIYAGEIDKIIEGKPDGKKYLNYEDAIRITDMVRDYFEEVVGLVPDEVEISLRLSEAVMAPTVAQKAQLIRGVTGIAGGATGVGMIVTGVGTVLGWGASMTATVIAFFTGTSLLGPVAWVAGGSAVAGIAAYFAITNNPKTNTDKFRECMKTSLTKSVDQIWELYGEKLSKSE